MYVGHVRKCIAKIKTTNAGNPSVHRAFLSLLTYGHISYNLPLPDEPRKGQTGKIFIHFLSVERNRSTVLYNSDQYRGARRSSKIGNVAATVPSNHHPARSLGGFDTKCLSTGYCVRVSFVVWRSLVYPAPSFAAWVITLYLCVAR